LIGFDLYTQMLAEAVAELRGEKSEPKIETVMEINIDAYLPGSYVPTQAQKIAIYKRILSASLSELNEIEDELLDRFGSPPIAVINLLRVARIRQLAHHAGILHIKQTATQTALSLASGVNYTINDAALLVRDLKGVLQHLPGRNSPFVLHCEDEQDLLHYLELFLLAFNKLAIR
jgi:transcription-repair coupling factor (superfamily II helicase)